MNKNFNMPGLKRFSIDELITELEEIENLGIKTVAIFPKINEKKTIKLLKV